MKPAEKYRAWKAHRPEKPIFRTILFSMMAVLLAEVILLSTGIGLTNVSGRLNQNAKQIVNMQVRNRASYLQDMLIKAQELTDISTTINNLTQQMLQDGTISLDTMDQSSEAADSLMEAAAPYLVSALRARPVTGIFLVINTHDLAEKEVGSPMPSVYLRDLDPDARPSDRNTDLMLERSSAAVVKALGITTDKSWSTALNCRGLTNGGFVRTVFQTAWEDDEKLDAADYGRWLTQTYKLTGDERTAIAYSQPLILPDGTVYGVIGVEILTSYLETKMPYQELQDGGQGTYLLVSTTSGLSDPELFLTLTAGDGLDANVIDAGVEKITCRQTDGERWLTLNDETGYAAVQSLDLYSRNAPFSNEKWLLVGTVRSSILFRFARTVQQVITAAVLLTLLLGAVSSLLVSRGLARPAEQLYCEVLAANGKQTFRKALEGFDNLRSKNLVDRQALIFINSIASVCLRREDSEYMDQRWHELRRQMVIEITEEEEMNREALEIKRHAPGFSGMFALDDYGSGYSNEGSLLELAPRFIKVDISIIRGIDSDPDKQQILRNVVRYAQPRSMQIIAEGVETAAEMRTVIDLGADLLQGYFLARPAAVPDPIAPEAAEIIRAI